MLEKLSTENPHPSSSHLDLLETEALLVLMNDSDALVPGVVARAVPQITAVVDAIVLALKARGRLIYVGAGTSGRLGVLDAAECPPTFGVSPDLVQGIIAGGPGAVIRSVEGAEDDVEAGARALDQAGIGNRDVVVGISASGRTPFVLGAIRWAREVGAVTCGISCATPSELSSAVRFPIEIPTGPEILTGSTRLRAGTATKLVLNMISTAVMVRLGYVYGNLMVNVQPTNAKLRDRARRIVEQAGGVDANRAKELLELSGWTVRTAIVMAKRGVGRVEAERLLAEAGGRIREALKESG
jgi:N-acetylmuramic acid 6-phosphate etherase